MKTTMTILALRGVTTMTMTTTTSFDDQGEPDFAGWLSAQSAAKQASKKPLPKGLAKTSSAPAKAQASRPTAGTAAKKKPLVVPVKKEVKPKKQGETEVQDDEGWGDAWE
jgi:SCY1-like protein 1